MYLASLWNALKTKQCTENSATGVQKKNKAIGKTCRGQEDIKCYVYNLKWLQKNNFCHTAALFLNPGRTVFSLWFNLIKTNSTQTALEQNLGSRKHISKDQCHFLALN